MAMENEMAQELKLLGQEGEELWDDDYGPDDEDYFASLYSKRQMEAESKLAIEKSQQDWAIALEDDDELALSTDAPF